MTEISTAPALKRVLFLSDLDGTWLSQNKANRAKLDQGILQMRDEYRQKGIDLQFGYVTARPPVRVAAEHLPTPDWTITFNGGFIHQGEAGHFEGTHYVVNAPLAAWVNQNDASHFTADKAAGAINKLLGEPQYHNLDLKTVGQVVANPAADDCPYYYSVCIDDKSVQLQPNETKDSNHDGLADIFDSGTFKAPTQIQQFAADVNRELKSEHVQDQVSAVYPFDSRSLVMFDITSPVADKGDAVTFLRDMQHLPSDHVIVAGNGGNDITMMRAKDGSDDGRRAIVVGGEADLYEAAANLKHVIAAPASQDCSLGVLDGLRQHLDEIAAEQ